MDSIRNTPLIPAKAGIHLLPFNPRQHPEMDAVFQRHERVFLRTLTPPIMEASHGG